DGNLVETAGFERGDAVTDLVPRAGHRHGTQELTVEERLLLGANVGQVALMQQEVPLVPREALVDRPVGLQRRLERGRQRERRAALFRLDGVVQDHDRLWPRLRPRTRRVVRLAVRQHAAEREARLPQGVRVAPDGLAIAVDLAQVLDRALDAEHEVDPAVRGLRRHAAALRREGRDVDGDRVLEVEAGEARRLIDEAELPGLASLDARRHGLPRPELAHHPDVFDHVRELHRPERHRAPRGEAGADAAIDAAWGERVQRSEG